MALDAANYPTFKLPFLYLRLLTPLTPAVYPQLLACLSKLLHIHDDLRTEYRDKFEHDESAVGSY